MRCLEARVSMQGARDDRGRDGLASPFVLGPAALCSGSGSAFFCIYLSRTSICRILCHGRGVLYLCGPFDLTTVWAI
jgi:hypothetical protein